MGLGDIINDIGDAIVPESVEDVAGGLVHGAQTAASVVGDVAQGAAWVANPYHWDDIQHGVGAAGSFIANHPGQAWDVAFEVGRHVVKEEILDPKNLAINLGMLAATTLTGGGAGAAWLAKLGEGARVGIGALRAVRAGEEVGGLARAGRAATTAMRASEEAWKVARAERAAVSGIRGAEAVSEATSAFGRAANKVTDIAEFMPRQFARAREAVTGNELGYLARGRAGLASSFEGANPGIAREMVGDVIRGSVMRPTAIGAGGRAERFAQSAYAVHRGEANLGHVEAVDTASKYGEEIYQFKKNPEAYVTKKAGLAGIDIEALRAGYQMLRGAKKLKGKKEEEEQPKKKRKPMAAGDVGGFASYDAPVSSYRQQRSRGGPGTSEEEYVESDFTVEQDRLGSFYRGMYQDRSIYDTAGAR